MSGTVKILEDWQPSERLWLAEVAGLSGFSCFAARTEYGRRVGVAYSTDPIDNPGERQGVMFPSFFMSKVDPSAIAAQMQWLWENAERLVGDQTLEGREFRAFPSLERLVREHAA